MAMPGDFMRRLAALWIVLAGTVWSMAADASPITVFTDRAAYDAAVAADPALTTHAAPANLDPPALGITSSSGWQPVNVITIGGVPYLSNQQNVITDTLDLAPDANVRAIAFDYFVGDPGGIPGTVKGLISVNGSVAASTTNSAGGKAVAVPFFGMISDSPIASIIITRTGTGNFTPSQIEAIKAISYATIATTPLPAALPLFVSALGGLGLFGWRRYCGAQLNGVSASGDGLRSITA
ncbi:MAG TPA: hypothetical protein VHA35_06110 [Dongiaceae bacterium]|nr:hypothetical protein [Dongiaceae bacterium]